MVKELQNITDFAAAIGNENAGLVIIDFFADWCGPCKRIAPLFAALAEKYPTVGFYKINADNKEISEVTNACMVKSLPTFCYFVCGKYVKNMVGSNASDLEKILLELLPSDTDKKEE